jgi:D-glycero-alpha-D-manno-heptose-7-phosphate kinase
MIITKTPLRASFFGGGTDLPSYFENSRLGFGSVLSTTVDINVYINVNRCYERIIRLCYRENEFASRISDVKHNLIRECLNAVGYDLQKDGGIEIFYSSDLPLTTAGMGMASSSAITVGLLMALYALKGVYVTTDTLARKAFEVESVRLDNHTGLQDQYACAFGGLNVYRFNNGGAVDVSPVVCTGEVRRQLEDNLMLYFTGSSHNSVEILSEQEKSNADNGDLLDELAQMPKTGAAMLAQGHLDEWGAMLDTAWNKKKHFASGVSNPQIDEMYETAKAAGALGGKVLGAGGGGFMLLYVPAENQSSVRQAMVGYKEQEFRFASQGAHIVFAD